MRLFSLGTWLLSSAAGRAHQILQARLAEAGVTGYEYRCLTALADGSMSQTQLGVAAALDARDVTHTVRALETRGLVTRTRDPDHGRRMLVTLTEAGSAASRLLTTVMDEVQAEVFGDLSVDERATLLALLRRVG